MQIARLHSNIYTNMATEDVAEADVVDLAVTVEVVEASRPVADAVEVTVVAEVVAVVDLATAADEEAAVEPPVDVVRPAVAVEELEELVVERMLHFHYHTRPSLTSPQQGHCRAPSPRRCLRRPRQGRSPCHQELDPW
jgi:hypothetical protein